MSGGRARGYTPPGVSSALSALNNGSTIQAGDIPIGVVDAGGGRFSPLHVGSDSDILVVDPTTHLPAWLGQWDWQPEDNGYLEGVCPPRITDSAAQVINALTGGAGILLGTRIKIRKARQLTNIIAQVFTAGTAPTGCYVAAWQNATLIGQSADQATPWSSTGPKVMPLVGGPFPIAKGFLDIGFWYGGGTPPAFSRPGLTTGATLSAGLSTANAMGWTGHSGLTTTAPSTLTKSIAIGTQTIVWIS